jgi:hypothetical protein
MESRSRNNSDFSPALAGEAAFERLLCLAASYPPQSSRMWIASPEGSDAARKNPIAEDIQVRAYHIYLERGAAHGHDLDDWLEAERQVFERLKRDRASLRLALAFGRLTDSPRK